uniref:Obscurin like cytoskeletal adaptor 1a n=1 Tax=Nothobranchius furzeri TaxID=105023 RepID=A0A8C6KEC3_NOTFU
MVSAKDLQDTHARQSSSTKSPKHRSGRFSLSRIVEEPPLNSSKVKKFAVTEGKHAKFRCCVTGKPKPEIIWKKDGVPLDPVLYCKVQDTGLYVCAASNALGNTLSAVHLSVKGIKEPDEDSSSTMLEQMMMESTFVRCLMEQRPLLSYQLKVGCIYLKLDKLL